MSYGKYSRTRLAWLAVITLLTVTAPPVFSWVWVEQESAVVPTLQKEFDEECASYRTQVDKGMKPQERLISLDRLVSNYKPQGIDTSVLEAERDRLIIQMDKDRQRTESAQKMSSELFQLAIQKVKIGRFDEGLSAIQRAERLTSEDKSIQEMRKKLESITAILPQATAPDKNGMLIRMGVTGYLENDATRTLNALRYLCQLNARNASYTRLLNMAESVFPNEQSPVLLPGVTLVDYKLQSVVEYVYAGQYLKAINECNQVLDLEPNNVLALTRLGSSYFAMNQKEKAMSYWRRALTLDPENQVLKRFLSGNFSTSD
ncbi:MAG TPA: tetratricopeptide repeat protein [Elusimicrobiota bacterium]|nr:tetratricopeptide repeat protein [Elusimicrobiota bacterium]